LFVSGAAAIACTNSPEDFGGNGGSGGIGSRKPREPNAASGEIAGDPETPNEETLNGGDPNADPGEEPPSEADAAPPPSPDGGAQSPPPDPDPDPDPGPDPIPAGSYAVGTELVTTANLNIRQGADTTYAIITTAPKGSRVTVVTVSGANGWVNVMWNGNVGWSSKGYLAVP